MQPILYLILPIFVYLQEDDEDSDSIGALKQKLLEFLDSKFSPHLLHKAAVFFNPAQKSMRALSNQDRRAALDYISDQLDSLPLRAHQPRIVPSAPTAPPPAKRRRHNISAFDDEPAQPVETSEMDQYQNYQATDTGLPILQWWRAHAKQFPALSTVARNILCIMATSAASERNFSLAGHVVSARRSCLNPANVNDILFMNSALKSGH